MRNLKSLNVDSSGYGTLLVPLINDKLPFHLGQCIAKKFDNEVWDLSEMLKILKTELESKERSILLGNPSDRNNHHNKYSSAALHSYSKSVPKKCIFCHENHSTNKC